MANFFFSDGAAMANLLSGAMKFMAWLLGAVVMIVVLIVALRWKKQKKSMNIPVTIWIPRSDGKIVDEIKAKGGYFKSHAVEGITSFRLKRPSVSVIDIPPPSSRFLVGLERHLYLVQKGMDDFEPVIPESFKTVQIENRDGTGSQERKAVINLKCINQDATAWKVDNAANAKKRFTLHGLWEKYKDFIQMTIFIFIVFLAIYIMWLGMKDFVTELSRLTDVLIGYNQNCPLVS